MTGLTTVEVIGPVTIKQVETALAWRGDCDGCESEDDGPVFVAADEGSARQMARRHWLMAHPDFEAVKA